MFGKEKKEQKCTQLAETVRNTQYAPSYAPAPSMELVFNPVTGEFEQAPAGSATSGEIVTDMTKDGFAF